MSTPSSQIRRPGGAERENIPTVSLCYDKGEGVESGATNVAEIIVELKTGKFANITERAGRAQDKDDGGGLETLRKDGYM